MQTATWVEEARPDGNLSFKIQTAELSEDEVNRLVTSIPRDFFALNAVMVGDAPPEDWPRVIDDLAGRLE